MDIQIVIRLTTSPKSFPRQISTPQYNNINNPHTHPQHRIHHILLQPTTPSTLLSNNIPPNHLKLVRLLQAVHHLFTIKFHHTHRRAPDLRSIMVTKAMKHLGTDTILVQ